VPAKSIPVGCLEKPLSPGCNLILFSLPLARDRQDQRERQCHRQTRCEMVAIDKRTSCSIKVVMLRKRKDVLMTAQVFS
jgi:hypothetical protein